MGEASEQQEIATEASALLPKGGPAAAAVAAPKAPDAGQRPFSVVAGACYFTVSASMILLNKAALSSFHFTATNSLLFFQCALCVVLVYASALAGWVQVEPLNWDIVRVWMPVNLLFTSMIGTGFYALQMMGVQMVTVLKNLTNVITISAEYFLYKRTYSAGVWASLLLTVASAFVGGATDLSFNAAGYFWQLVNCSATAGYHLYLRTAMDKVKPHTRSGERLNEVSMTLYFNLLSLPFLLALMALQGELTTLWEQPDLWNPRFQAVAVMTGFMGFAISFVTLWFLSTTTATIFGLVGTLAKIPVAMAGLLLFESTWSYTNVGSVLVGCLAGVAFVRAKQNMAASAPPPAAAAPAAPAAAAAAAAPPAK